MNIKYLVQCLESGKLYIMLAVVSVCCCCCFYLGKQLLSLSLRVVKM